MLTKFKLPIVLLVSILGFLFTFTQVKAIGVSPSIVGVDDLANGMTVEKEIFIVRVNPKVDNAFKVTLEGEGSKYIELSSEKIILPKGAEQVPYKFKLKPVGAPNGTYNVKLVFDGTTPDDGDKAGQNSVAVIAGITARINFTITDKQVKKLQISNLYADEAEVNQSLVLHFRVKNLGNVDVKPELIKVTLTDRMDPSQVFTDEISAENIALVGPSQDEIVSVKLKPTIPKGNYMLKAEFYSEGQVIYSQEIVASIFPEGTLAQKLDIVSVQVSSEKIGVGESVRFLSTVKNTGEIVLEPVFVVKVLKDGQQLEFLRSEKQLILKNEEGTYSLNYRPEALGEYTATTYFEFGVRKTDVKELHFSVAKDESLKYAIIGGGLLLLIILIITFIILAIKKHKKKKTVESSVTGVSPTVSAPVSPNPIIPQIPSVQAPVNTTPVVQTQNVPPVPTPVVSNEGNSLPPDDQQNSAQ